LEDAFVEITGIAAEAMAREKEQAKKRREPWLKNGSTA
jgi:hypothetical protein